MAVAGLTEKCKQTALFRILRSEKCDVSCSWHLSLSHMVHYDFFDVIGSCYSSASISYILREENSGAPVLMKDLYDSEHSFPSNQHASTTSRRP